MSYVYCYEDPRSGVPRYIGKGTKPNRLRIHLRNAGNRNLRAMIFACEKQLVEVNPFILCDGLSQNAAKAIEIFWIAVIGRGDMAVGPLFNGTDGGDGVVGRRGFKRPPRSEEWCRKNSASQKASIHKKATHASVEYREKQRIAQTGNLRGPQETIQCLCGKVGGKGIMKRWHLTNCRSIKND